MLAAAEKNRGVILHCLRWADRQLLHTTTDCGSLAQSSLLTVGSFVCGKRARRHHSHNIAARRCRLENVLYRLYHQQTVIGRMTFITTSHRLEFRLPLLKSRPHGEIEKSSLSLCIIICPVARHSKSGSIDALQRSSSSSSSSSRDYGSAHFNDFTTV